MDAKSLIDALWINYSQKQKQLTEVISLFDSRGEIYYLDHFALRTLSKQHFHQVINIFETLGFTKQDRYVFEDKKLEAFWLKPPISTPEDSLALPKVFVSRLCIELFQQDVQDCINDYLSSDRSIVQPVIGRTDSMYRFLLEPPKWRRPSFQDYSWLQTKSEYAAWTLAWGNMINHFAFACQQLKSFRSLDEVNLTLRSRGLCLNTSGGEIKGSESLKLRQSSTMAELAEYTFVDITRSIPSSFIEFSWRFFQSKESTPGLWNSYYQGFVTSNADRIFESTDVISSTLP